jgi:hypothetical protein
VLSKDLSSSLQVLLVTNDTCLLISVEELAQTIGVAAITDDVESNSTLAFIIRHANVSLIKEQGKIITGEPKNVLRL